MARSFDPELTDLVHTLGLLVRRIRAAADSHDISLSESSVLRRLEAEGAATIADLARADRVKPQSMGATVAALEAAGLITRRPHPTDRRQVLIEITPAGTALRRDTRDAKRAWLAREVAALAPDEQATLYRATSILRSIAEQ